MLRVVWFRASRAMIRAKTASVSRSSSNGIPTVGRAGRLPRSAGDDEVIDRESARAGDHDPHHERDVGEFDGAGEIRETGNLVRLCRDEGDDPGDGEGKRGQ